jgi:hypothetical protein
MIALETVGHIHPSSKLDNLPGYIGLVSNLPFTDTRNLRLGLSITRAVSWSPGSIDQTFDAAQLGYDRLNYSSSANFQSQLYPGCCRMGTGAGPIDPARPRRGDRRVARPLSSK